VEAWPAHSKVLNKYKHHFSFTINGPNHSILEPGVTATLNERMEQLRWIVDKCLELGQDPNASIVVKVDPISVYTVPPSGDMRDTLGHIPALVEWMMVFSLNRLHISFTQFSFPTVRGRARRMSERLFIHELSSEEERVLLETKLFPYTGPAKIKVQTCTAINAVNYYREHKVSGTLVQGSCVGWRDIQSITNGESQIAFTLPPEKASPTRFCSCYPFRDVGDKSKGCIHGCRYCFSNPLEYDF
jgi:hypothetical protein